MIFLSKYFLLGVYVCMCELLCALLCVPCKSEGERVALSSWFPPTCIWVPGLKVRSPGLHTPCFTAQLSHWPQASAS